MGFCELVLILDMILNKCMTVGRKLNKSDFAAVKNSLNMVLKEKDKPDWENCFQLAYPVKTNQPCIQKHMFKFSKFHKISKPQFINR